MDKTTKTYAGAWSVVTRTLQEDLMVDLFSIDRITQLRNDVRTAIRDSQELLPRNERERNLKRDIAALEGKIDFETLRSVWLAYPAISDVADAAQAIGVTAMEPVGAQIGG